MNNHTPNSMNTTPINDDPMLTAYALGELSGDDVAVVEQRLAASDSLRSEVEAIRTTANALRSEFAAEPAQSLTASQRSKVMNVASAQPPLRLASEADSPDNVVDRRATMTRSRWIGSGLAAAAMITLTVTAAMIYFRGDVDSGFAVNSGDTAVPGSGAVGSRSNAAPIGGETTSESRGLNGERGRLALADEKKDKQTAPDSNVLSHLESGLRQAGADVSLSGAVAANEQAVVATVQPSLPMRESERRDQSPTPKPSAESNFVPTTATPNPTPTQLPPPPPPAPGAGLGDNGRGAESAGGRGGPVPAAGGAGGASTSPGDTRKEPAAPADPSPASGAPARDRDAASSPPVASPAEGAARPGDADDANIRARGGLRDPSRRESETHEVAAPRYEESQIAAMDEGEVQEALELTRRAKELDNIDSRTEALLRAQDARLNDRLRAIERIDAEEYSRINDNPFIQPVGEDALSTFALDVDTASYSNIRRFLTEGRLPPADAVRIEEMINYFKYDYAPPTLAKEGEEPAPFSANLELAPAPWNPEHQLLRIGIRGKDVRMDMRPATSLVFLIDVSGSMNAANKLPLVKQAMAMLAEQLNADDRLAIVTYAGNAGLVLDSCFVNASNRVAIDAAIENMRPGGSTNGAGGINLAYDVARRNFIKDGVNRVILCTDGDFNVGVSGDDALVQLIEDQRKSNVFLTVLGFGSGNFKDAKMEKLTNAGNGNFAYIDSVKEAKKVLVEQAGGTLVTIAKDVKFQIEFNPAKVGAYRLIGYENRMLAAQDFNNDLKDAGEIGSGHTMTALYEIVPVGAEAAALAKNEPQGEVDELKYQKPTPPAAVTTTAAAAAADSDELLEVKIRFKQPEGDVSSLLRFPLKETSVRDIKPTDDFRFAAAVAEFGMLLRRSQYVVGGTFDHVIAEAEGSMGDDAEGYRAEFIELVKKARSIENAE